MGRRKQKRKRKSPKSDKYRDPVLEQLRICPRFSSRQIYNNIARQMAERGEEMDVSENTIRNLTRALRIEHGIEKPKSGQKGKTRSYRGVPDPEPGIQAQYDFGEQIIDTVDGGTQKVHWGMVILSYSRYRYVEFQTTPVTGADAVRMLKNGIEYFGGSPKEVVIDQDSVMVAGEKRGEVTLTEEFGAFVGRMPFRMRVLSKADPESKGKVERANLYLEQSLLNGYRFESIKKLNGDAAWWLENIANAKPNGTTKKAPGDMLEIERKHLLPSAGTRRPPSEIITHAVNKDNSVWYGDNRYEVPEGTYLEGLGVRASVYVYGDHLDIYHSETGGLLATHPLDPEARGRLFTLDNRKDNNERSARKWSRKALKALEFYGYGDLIVKKIVESNPDFQAKQLKWLVETVEEWKSQKKLLAYVFDQCLRLESLQVSQINEMIDSEIKRMDLDPNPEPKRESLDERWKKISEIDGAEDGEREIIRFHFRQADGYGF